MTDLTTIFKTCILAYFCADCKVRIIKHEALVI